MSDQPEQEVRRLYAKRKETKFILELENGDMQVTMRELDGALRDQWMNESKQKVEWKDGKMVPKDFTGLYSSLLSKTLYGPDDKPIVSAMIQKWPTTVQKELFELSQEQSNLKPNAEEQAKNA